MALPVDEEDWKNLDIIFAARSGGVRRNSLADFTRVNRGGKIAMKPAEGDGIVAVRLCTEDDDALLTTANGKSIRFKVTDIRRFVGRTSSGVRGIKLAALRAKLSDTEIENILFSNAYKLFNRK